MQGHEPLTADPAGGGAQGLPQLRAGLLGICAVASSLLSFQVLEGP